MSHYYSTKEGSIELLENVKTASQAKKHGSALISVTTVLSFLPAGYLENVWKPTKIMELARKYESAGMETLKDLLWGMRRCPATSDMIKSSDYGTNAHARMEELIDSQMEDGLLPTGHPYDGVCLDTFDYIIKNKFTPLHTEIKIACLERGIAGTIDLVALDSDEKVCLLDYKFRDCADGKIKAYDKDCSQLAIEALIWQEQNDLDYIPDCYTVCVDVNTGTPHVKKWTSRMVIKGIKRFESAREMYYSNPDLGG